MSRGKSFKFQENKTLITQGVKICTTCHITKDLNEFRTRKSKSGYTSYCKTCESLKHKETYKLTAQHRLAVNAAWRARNKDRINELSSTWKKIHKEKHAATQAKRRANKLQATPNWADLKAIEQFYLRCPPGYHVDHIIPLKGKNVSGLHVLSNLQYLLASDNIRKSNKVA